jgi:nicotinate-nucleotide adenylyltransferase
MGGTFDPIHIGHLTVAMEAREAFGLDKVLFVPAGNPVFKQNKKITPAEDRYNMCVLACNCRDTINNASDFSVSRIEIERQGLTYTIDTISELKKENPNAELFFILGQDAFDSFERWRDSEKILELCTLIPVPRELPISSTIVREKIAKGECVKGLIPDVVLEYIRTNELYKA